MATVQTQIRIDEDLKRDTTAIFAALGLDVNLLNRIVNVLQKGESLDAKYCDHALTGEYKGHRECHIQPRLVIDIPD